MPGNQHRRLRGVYMLPNQAAQGFKIKGVYEVNFFKTRGPGYIFDGYGHGGLF